jgi:Ca2+-binding RTX toxin-like protein
MVALIPHELISEGNTQMKKVSRLLTTGVLLTVASLAARAQNATFDPVNPMAAALVKENNGPQLLIGRDDDNVNNAQIQAGAAANQSLDRTDIIEGGSGNDVIFGLNGDDVIDGGSGQDIILGGPDGGAAPGGPPNSDIMFGGRGNDINLWAPGDGSETFIGGRGLDAIIFGATDRDAVPDLATGVRLPTLRFGVEGFPQGIPTADVSGLVQHCTVERSPLSGYDFLVRFRGPAGNIIVTVRLAGVEQVFCPSEAGAGIAFADLTRPSPAFVDVSQQQVETLNPLLAAMIR